MADDILDSSGVVTSGTQDTVCRELSIDEWRSLCGEGVPLAVHIFPKGVSMLPLIVQGRDSVIVYPVNRELLPGDIVLFRRSDGANVLHRIRRIEGDSITTFGDGCLRPDKPIRRSDIMGLAVTVNHKGKLYNVDCPASRFQGRIWWCLYPVRWCKKLPRRIAHKVIREWLGIKRKNT